MNIAIITGGSGLEREISIQSAKYISKMINFGEIQIFNYPEEYECFLKKSSMFDCVIPMIHGDDGEDGKLQKDFENRNIKYIFSNSEAHQKCFNKNITKKYISNLEVSIPKTYQFTSKDIIFPIIAKPQSGGSSFNLYFIENQEQLNEIGFIPNYIYEQYILGREFTIGVIDSQEGLIVLPIMEIDKKTAIFSYNEKYSELSKEIEIFPTDMSVALQNILKNTALQIHKRLGLKNLSRTDVIVQNNKIYFLEINTIPGCTEKSFIPKMINKANLNISEVLKYWIKKELT
jgi:D-alanine-D-alanine ligase